MGSAHLRPPAASVQASVLRLSSLAVPPLELLAEVARVVRTAVPYDVSGWLLTDPATLLATGIHSEGVDPYLQRRLVEQELAVADVNSFAVLASGRRPARRLSAATRGQLDRSARHRALYAPNGFGDELRAVFRTAGGCWGQVCLTRREDQPHFTDAEIDVLARLVEPVGHALRTALAVAGHGRPGSSGPGVLVLDGDDQLDSLDCAAERWLRTLPAGRLELPDVVHTVARQARRLADPAADPGGFPVVPAMARVRGRDGGYLTVRGTCLAARGSGPHRVAVVLEPARSDALSPLVMALADLTRREQEITQLLLRGAATAEIARALWISPHTLRGHIKSIFAKLGVHSRPELAALLYEQTSPGGAAPRSLDLPQRRAGGRTRS